MFKRVVFVRFKVLVMVNESEWESCLQFMRHLNVEIHIYHCASLSIERKCQDPWQLHLVGEMTYETQDKKENMP